MDLISSSNKDNKPPAKLLVPTVYSNLEKVTTSHNTRQSKVNSNSTTGGDIGEETTSNKINETKTIREKLGSALNPAEKFISSNSKHLY